MAETAVATKQHVAEIMEQVIVKGDLSKLTPAERSNYYMTVCKSVGLNPLTKPFEYITLNSKLTLYALRGCTDQLRSIHGVSVEEVSERTHNGVFIVTAKVRDKHERTDVSTGAVTIGNLKGDALCNAMMKAETKAKRRATLSICGLGFLDESEIETVPRNARSEPRDVTPKREPPKAVEAQPPIDPETGEVLPPSAIKVGITEDKQPDWQAWTVTFAAALNAAQTVDEIDAWMNENKDPLNNLKAGSGYENSEANVKRCQDRHARLLALADDHRATLADTPTDLPAEVAQGEPDLDVLAAG